MQYNTLPVKGVTLKTEFLGTQNGRDYFRYEFRWNRKLVFSGKDFSPSPMDMPRYGWTDTLPLRSRASLVSFLTLKPGDTDSEYFDGYTDLQNEFIESDEADDLRLFVYDTEESGE